MVLGLVCKSVLRSAVRSLVVTETAPSSVCVPVLNLREISSVSPLVHSLCTLWNPRPSTTASSVRWMSAKGVSSSQTSKGAEKRQHAFRVEATYVGSMINIYDLMNMKEYKDSFKAIHKGSALIGLSQYSASNSQDGLPFGPYMAVTTYGSAVFFDTSKELKNSCLSLIEAAVHEPLVERNYNEEFIMSVDPGISSWSTLDPDCIILQKMDLKNIQVISHVLAQSVALDYYSSHVERTLETFCSLNQEMMETASISKLNKQVLLQLVAENNIVMTEIISKLGVHERYDIAWKYAKYGKIWDFLRTELEIETRFETLDMKLNLLQDNLKYFLEILQNRKSDALEWIIIVLIAMEIILSLYQIAQDHYI
jgi:uncharacterized Rmd1/YagE family protein